MIRKLGKGKWRLYSRKVNPRTGKRRNLGTFTSKKAALQHERDIQYFKRHYSFASSPGAAQRRAKRNGALQNRDRYELRDWKGPGSAVQHFAIARRRRA